MGFGIMFLGFMLTYLGALTPLYVFTYAIGSIVILFSLKNLIAENKWFLVSAVISALLEIISLIILVLFAVDKEGRAYNILCSCQTYMAYALTVTLLFAVYIIAKQVGLTKIQSKVIIDGAVFLIALAASAIALMLKDDKIASYIGVVSMICRIVYIIFTLVILFNCYVRICYAGDEDMSNQDTGMDVLNTLNKKLNKAMEKDKYLNKKDRKK